MFKVLKFVIFMNQILFQVISHMYMLNIAIVNNNKNLSFRFKGHKTEQCIFSVTNIETTSVHHFPALC